MPNLHKTVRNLLIAAVAILSLALPKHAQAQIPTTDFANIAQAASMVSSMGSQINSIEQTVSGLTNILNVQTLISQTLGSAGSAITDIGGSTIGTILQDANMGLSDYYNVSNKIETMQAEVQNILNNPMNLNGAIGNIQAIYTQLDSLPSFGSNTTLTSEASSMSGVLSGTASLSQSQQTIESTLYTSSPSPSALDAENVQVMRENVAQNASTGGLMVSTATMDSLSADSGSAVASLASAVSAATDERGDVKANSAIELKILEQITLENQLLSWLIRIRAADSINSQPTYVDNAVLSSSTTTSGTGSN